MASSALLEVAAAYKVYALLSGSFQHVFRSDFFLPP